MPVLGLRYESAPVAIKIDGVNERPLQMSPSLPCISLRPTWPLETPCWLVKITTFLLQQASENEVRSSRDDARSRRRTRSRVAGAGARARLDPTTASRVVQC